MKTCRICNASRSILEFSMDRSSRDGRRSYCKPCANAAEARRRAAPGFLDRKRAYRMGRDRRAESQRYYAKHREAILRRSRDRRDPQAARAHYLVFRAKRSGDLTAEPCEKCGAENVQAHHDDYSRPLDVRWLCVSCHRIEHVRGGRK